MRTPAKPVIRKQLKPSKEPADLSSVRASLSTLQDQLTAQPRILPHSEGGKRPKGVRQGDRLMGRGARGIVFGIPDTQGNVKQSEVPDTVTQYQDQQSGIVPPTVADNFPNDGDFGWYRDTVSTLTYMALNSGGTLYTIKNGGFDFTDISGTITAAQHGDFTAVAANDNLHALATTSRPGFLSAAVKSSLNNTFGTSSASETLNCTSLYINNVEVMTGSYNATFGGIAGPAGAAYTATERAMLNDLKTAVNEIAIGLLAIKIFF